MIQNTLTQRKITEANQSLSRSTIILAIATIALVITTAYGASGLESAIDQSLKFVLVLFFIGIVLWALGIFGKIFKLLIKLIK